MSKTKAMQNAEADGYTREGYYYLFKSGAKAMAVQLRKEGYRARCIFQPSSPYARGGNSGGYKIYTKPTEKKLKEIEVEKIAKQVKSINDLRMIKDYLSKRNPGELVNLLGRALAISSGQTVFDFAKKRI